MIRPWATGVLLVLALVLSRTLGLAAPQWLLAAAILAAAASGTALVGLPDASAVGSELTYLALVLALVTTFIRRRAPEETTGPIEEP